MNFAETFRMALQNINNNRLRSVLTLLIIAFGIMSLVGILTAIDALTGSLNDSFSGLGANSFSFERKWGDVHANHGGRQSKVGERIGYDQAMGFKERFDFPAKVSVSFGADAEVTVKWGDKKTNPNVGIFGIGENYLKAKGFEVEFGRAFSESEINDGRHVCLLGADVAEKLFGTSHDRAVGNDVSVDNARYRVIGVLKSKGSGMNKSEDRRVLGTLDAVKTDFGAANSGFDVLVSVDDATKMEAAIGEATGLFRQLRGLRPGEEDDFEIEKSDSIAAVLKENTVKLRLATIAIGLMTLLGAAIGLMNIMLVSVTERTKEIGIIKALGATRRVIMTQFLSEAIVICLIGGAVGVLLGILMGNIVTIVFHGKFLIPWVWMTLGFALCFFVGIVSGLYPALKAARLDPIEALRYE